MDWIFVDRNDERDADALNEVIFDEIN